jgi:predicted phage tail protein
MLKPITGSGGGGKGGGGGGSIPTEAPNTLKSITTARIIDLLGEGEIGGLVNGAQSIFFDNTPLQNPDGSFNFTGINFEQRVGLPDQQAFAGFPTIESESRVGSKVTTTAPVVRTISNATLDAIRLKVQVPSLNQLLSSGQLVGAEVLFKIEVQPNGGAYTAQKLGISQQSFGGLQSPANTTGLAVVIKPNYQVGSYGSSTNRWYSYGYSYTVEYRKQGTTTWLVMGSASGSTRENDDSFNHSVGNLVTGIYELRLTGCSIVSALATVPSEGILIAGKTVSPYEAEYRIDLPAGGAPWNIRLSRITADSTATTLNNDLYWSSYTEVTDQKLIYPDSAMVGLQVQASAFGGQIPARGYEVYGRIIKVPINYDPIARTYTGLWNGTFKSAWTDNPAWVVYDLLTDKRAGLGDSIAAANVDKWGLYEIAKYCDELVSDGTGGLEPRFRFNGVIATAADAYQVINLVVSTMRAMTYWSAGGIAFAQDSPATPTRLASPANVVDGLFIYAGTPLKSRHSVVQVTWNDPADGYRPAVELVEDTTAIQNYGWRPTDVVAYGCTSRAQAIRLGKWLLDTEKNQNQTVTFRAGFDYADCRPGEVIAIQDPDYAAARMAGRVMAATTNSITVDNPISVVAGQSYSLSVAMPNGTIATAAITNSAGSTSTVTLATPLPQTPLVGGMWMVTASNLAPRQFRVLAKKELEPHVFEITALLHDQTKYARVEQGINLSVAAASLVETGQLKPPLNLASQEFLYQSIASVEAGVTISWQPSPDARARYYEVELAALGQSFLPQGTVTGGGLDIKNISAGLYRVRVRAKDGLLSNASPWLEASITIYGKAAPPADVTGFAVNIIDAQAYLSWDSVPDLDLDYYWIKYSPATVGASWASATDLVVKVSKTATSVAVPAMVGSYLIKAVDQSGSTSTNAALVSSTINALDGLNFVATLTESPGFGGSKTGVYLSPTGLVLDTAELFDSAAGLFDSRTGLFDNGNRVVTGSYQFASPYDLGAVYTSRLTASLTVGVADFSNSLFDDAPGLFDARAGLFDAVPDDACFAELYIATTNDNPLASPIWSAWKPFIVGDYTARAYRFKLDLSTNNPLYSPRVSSLSVQIDMPDRLAVNNDVVCPAGGLTITYAQPFKEKPALAIAAQNMATGDTYAITAATKNGFTIQFFNSAGTGVSRTFDWHAKGFGQST